MRGESRDRPSSDWLWEESVILTEAESEEDAVVLAQSQGRAAECSFTSGSGEAIHWVFDRVAQVYQILGTPRSGCEVFSRHLRASEVASLESSIE